jgi:hypothetical protein
MQARVGAHSSGWPQRSASEDGGRENPDSLAGRAPARGRLEVLFRGVVFGGLSRESQGGIAAVAL